MTRTPIAKTALQRGALLLALILFLPFLVRSQVVFSINTTKTGDTVTADFAVKNFTDIVGFQFTIGWDVTEMAFQGLHSFNLPDMGPANFGTGLTSTGNLVVSWYDAHIGVVTFPSCPPIFSINFLITGSGSIPPINISGALTSIELIDVNGNLLQLIQGDFTPTVFEASEQAVICAGETYFYRGNSFSQAGTYEIPVSNGADCDSLFTLTLEVATPPQADIETLVQGCSGEPSGQVRVTPTGGAGGPYIVTLNGIPLQAPFVADGLPTGNYTLFVEDAAGCTQEQTFTLDVPDPLWLSAGPDLEIIAGDSARITLSTNVAGIASVSWEPQTGLRVLPNGLSVFAAPTATTTYTVSLLTDDGCLLTDQLTVTVVDRAITVYVPNAFSPNGDGFNDVFRPFPANGIRVEEFKVFGRWGEFIFDSTGANGWDGTFRGKDMPPGIFGYLLIVASPDGRKEQLTGDVLLIR